MFDITSLKLAEQELEHALELEREATARLRALDEMKNTFLQAVSHDLRTPLATVMGSALMLDSPEVNLSDEDSRDLIHGIAVNAEKLARLVTDLLDLDRLSSGLLEPNRDPVDVAELVGRVVGESEAFIGRAVETQASTVVVDLDAPKVERIVENLLVNAARHTPKEAGIWVIVESREGGVEIRVEDEGPGIPEELRASIFEAFERGPTPSAHAPGSGIGLTLVARFAELHGGRAWVEERVGGGSSFRVFLPGAPQG
jgi:Osmosensitive K+ channel histidine kinase